MKKYKLIKEYPGSPKLNTIVEIPELCIKTFTVGIWQHFIPGSPEFWEEVVEKDYEILKLVSSKSNPRYHTGAKILDNKDYKFKNMYPTEYWDIYEIKRLSDGEVFTIGDKFDVYFTDNTYTILKFEIRNNELFIHNKEYLGNTILTKVSKVKQPLFTTEDGVDVEEDITIVYWIFLKENKWNIDINSPTPYYQISVNSGRWKAFSTIEARLKWMKEKYPKPLFTTEDGVDIFKGDKFYSTRKDCSGSIIKYNGNPLEIASTKSEDFVDFSTKEAAQDYILMNKPCLSLNDIVNADLFSKYGRQMRVLLDYVKRQQSV